MNENRNAKNKKELNYSEINDTEALMNQLDLLSFTEDKSFDDITLFQKSHERRSKWLILLLQSRNS